MYFDIEKRMIYEDGEILVLHKPSGVAVQNARMGVPDLESLLKNRIAERNPRKIPYLGIVHRLDQPVEGVMVFAKTPHAAKELSRQISAGETSKRYLAVTTHQPAAKEGILEDYLVKDGKTNTSRVVSEGTGGAKKARLLYRILEEIPDERAGKRFLIGIQLETGRHHQIRVQMAHAGMPLLGDRKYHAEEKTEMPLGLCSCELSFRHPGNGKKMNFRVFPDGGAFVGFQTRE